MYNLTFFFTRYRALSTSYWVGCNHYSHLALEFTGILAVSLPLLGLIVASASHHGRKVLTCDINAIERTCRIVNTNFPLLLITNITYQQKL